MLHNFLVQYPWAPLLVLVTSLGIGFLLIWKSRMACVASKTLSFDEPRLTAGQEVIQRLRSVEEEARKLLQELVALQPEVVRIRSRIMDPAEVRDLCRRPEDLAEVHQRVRNLFSLIQTIKNIGTAFDVRTHVSS